MNLERRHSDQIQKYSSLWDQNLQAYFQSPAMKKHLSRIGLLKDGKLMSEAEYKNYVIKEEHKTTSQRMMAQQIYLKTRDFDLGRQLELQRQLDAVKNVELYRKIRGTVNTQDTDLLQMKPIDLERSFGKSSANSIRRLRRTASSSGTGNNDSTPDDQRLQTASDNGGRASSGYQTDDDGQNRISLTRRKQQQNQFGANDSQHMHRYLNDVSKFQQLHKLDNTSLETYKEHLQKELKQVKDARDQLPQITPDSLIGGTSSIPRSWSGRSGFSDDALVQYKNLPDNYHEYRKSLIRSVSTGLSSSANRQSPERKRRANEVSSGKVRNRSRSPYKQQHFPPLLPNNKKVRTQKEKEMLARTYMTSAGVKKRRTNQPSCVCFLQYVGSSFSGVTDHGKWPKSHAISIQQQHNGGNQITVFKEELVAGTEFYFFSYRHVGFSFSLSVIEDGQVIQRVGACCESRLSPGARLGGKNGALRWLGVRKAVPCYKCQVERELEAPYTNYEPKDQALLEKVIEKEELLSKPHQRMGTTLPLAAGKSPVIRGQTVEKNKFELAPKSSQRLLIKNTLVRDTVVHYEDDKSKIWPKGLAATDEPPNKPTKKKGKIKKPVPKPVEQPAISSASSSSSRSDSETDNVSKKSSHSRKTTEGGESLKSYHTSSYSNSSESRSESETENDSKAKDETNKQDKVEPTVKIAEEVTNGDKSSDSGSSSSSESEIELSDKPGTSKAILAGESEPPVTGLHPNIAAKRIQRHYRAYKEKKNNIEHHSVSDEPLSPKLLRRESAVSKSSTGSNSSSALSGSSTSQTSTSKLSEGERKARRINKRKEEDERSQEFGSRLQRAGSALLRLEEKFDSNLQETERISSSQSAVRKPSETSAIANDNQSINTDAISSRKNSQWSAKTTESEEKIGADGDSQMEAQFEGTLENEESIKSSKSSNSSIKSSSTKSPESSETESETETTAKKGNISIPENQVELPDNQQDHEHPENHAAVPDNKEHSDPENQTGDPENPESNSSSESHEETAKSSEKSKKSRKSINSEDHEHLENHAVALDNQEHSEDPENQAGDRENPDSSSSSESDEETTRNSEKSKKSRKSINSEANKSETVSQRSGLAREEKEEISESNAAPNGNESQDEEWLCKVCNFENPHWEDKCRICQADQGEEPPASSTTGEESESSESGESSETETESKTDSKSKASRKSSQSKASNSSKKSDSKSGSISKSGSKESSNKLKPLENNDNQADKISANSVHSKSKSSSSDSSDTDTLADAQSIRSHQESNNPELLLAPEITVENATPSPRPSTSAAVNQRIPSDGDNHSVGSDMSAANRILKKFGDQTKVLEEAKEEEDKGAKPEDQDNQEEEENEDETFLLPKPLRQVCKSGEDVSLTGTDLSFLEAVKEVGKLLAGNSNLKSLYLRNTGLNDEGMKILAQKLQECPGPLKVLNLNMNGLSANAVQPLVRLVKSKPIAILMLHENKFSDYDMKELLSSLSEAGENIQLRRLDIGENQMGPKGAKALSVLMANNQSIKSLNMGGNKSLKPDDWRIIAEGLVLNQSVESLNMDYCEMQDEGANPIFQALKNKPSLKILDLDGNKLTDKSASGMLEMVRSCPHLENVVLLAGNSISNAKMLTLRQILSAKNAKDKDDKDFLSIETSHYIKSTDLKL